MPEPGKRVLLYLRQSDTDDAGEGSLSLDSQARVLAERAAAEGWRVVAEVRDADLRGWMDETQRPALAEALRRAEAGDYDVLLVYDLSRLARSLRLQENVLHRLGTAGVEVCSHCEPWASTSPLLRHVIGAVAEERTRELSRNVTRAIREQRRRGFHWCGRPPFGYRRPEPGKPMEPDPATAAHAVEFFTRYAAGEAITVIADAFTARGIPSPRGHRVWGVKTIAHILRNPVYAGSVMADGELIEGRHEALIARDTWHAVQTRLEARQRPVRRKATASWLEGLIVHAEPCGAPLYLMAPQRPSWRARFRCRHAGNRGDRRAPACPVRPDGAPVVAAEAAVRRLLVADLAGRLPLATVLDEARRHHAATHPLVERRRRDLADRRRRAASRRARAEDLYLGGARDRVWFDAEDALAAADLGQVELEIAALPEAPSEDRLGLLADWLDGATAALADPRCPSAALAAFLRGAGVAVLGPDGIAIRYRPEVARFLGRAESGRIGAGTREAMFARAVALKDGRTWPDVWRLIGGEYPGESLPTVNALRRGVYERARKGRFGG